MFWLVYYFSQTTASCDAISFTTRSISYGTLQPDWTSSVKIFCKNNSIGSLTWSKFRAGFLNFKKNFRSVEKNETAGFI